MGDAGRALSRCVGNVAAFLDSRWGRVAHHHRCRDGYGDLLSLDDVDGIVTSSGLRAPAFRLVRDGEQLPARSYTRSARIGSRPVGDLVDPGRVFALFDDGATIVLQGLQRSWPPLATFCRDLEATLTHPVQANAYITPPVATGLRIHADAHDVFALQTAGCKQWVTYSHDDEPVLDLRLQSGECLYLPQGVRHAARTVDEPSVHVTIGVRTVTWEHVLRRAVDGVMADIRDGSSRDPLPAGFAHDPDALAEELADRLRALAKQVEAVDAGAVAHRAAEAFWSSRPPLLAGQLRQLLAAATVDDGTVVGRRPGIACAITVEASGVVLVLGDRCVRLPTRVEPAVRWLLAQERCAVGDLAPFLDHDGRQVLVSRLVRESLLMIES